MIPSYTRISLENFPSKTPVDAFNLSVQAIAATLPCTDAALAEKLVYDIKRYVEVLLLRF